MITRILPSGEANKNLDQLSSLIDWLLGEAVERRDLLIALGGGVIGDLVGFTAAVTLRGIHFMLESLLQLDFAECAALLDLAATLKLNTILLEFGPQFFKVVDLAGDGEAITSIWIPEGLQTSFTQIYQ